MSFSQLKEVRNAHIVAVLPGFGWLHLRTSTTLYLLDYTVLAVGLRCIEPSRWAEHLTATLDSKSVAHWTEVTAFSFSNGAQESASSFVSPLIFRLGQLDFQVYCLLG